MPDAKTDTKTGVKIGVDFGGTKIEAAALGADGAFRARVRAPNPGAYDTAIRTVRELVAQAEQGAGAQGTIGIGAPGSVSPRTRMLRNANSTYLNGRPFGADLEAALGRDIRMANDANCLALSEAVDGAAAGAHVVFAIILGTGCGGGIAVDGRVIEGANGIAGEWGHTPLPWANADEHPGPDCWCGQRGCLETWIAGVCGFERDFRDTTGRTLTAEEIVAAARSGDLEAADALAHYLDRLARAMAMIANILDPDAFVIGGGMSNVTELYDRLPDLIRAHVFSDAWDARIAPARWGDSSGVRGAARLWD